MLAHKHPTSLIISAQALKTRAWCRDARLAVWWKEKGFQNKNVCTLVLFFIIRSSVFTKDLQTEKGQRFWFFYRNLELFMGTDFDWCYITSVASNNFHILLTLNIKAWWHLLLHCLFHDGWWQPIWCMESICKGFFLSFSPHITVPQQDLHLATVFIDAKNAEVKIPAKLGLKGGLGSLLSL